MIPTDKLYLDYLRQVLTLDVFETFCRSSILKKSVFFLGVEQGMLINDKCSSWCNRVGDILVLVWDRRKEILYGNGLVHVHVSEVS